ncbi:MAG: hypothetical protein AUK59_06705 [Candidatus Altarchaeum sp. CG2_30_32_3053]|nr:MAG: hypothetical protein AUK59_06705 [Candidatus Altarchaeum sp. CG2_30_32_3053]
MIKPTNVFCVFVFVFYKMSSYKIYLPQLIESVHFKFNLLVINFNSVINFQNTRHKLFNIKISYNKL